MSVPEKIKKIICLSQAKPFGKKTSFCICCVFFVYVVCLAGNEAKGAAQNRVRWRPLVEELCSTRNEEE